MIILEVVLLRKKPIGLVAATSKSNVGYSLFNIVKEKRQWDIGLATKIAVGRAEKVDDPLNRLYEIHDMLKERLQPEMRVILMVRAVKRMIKKAKKTRW